MWGVNLLFLQYFVMCACTSRAVAWLKSHKTTVETGMLMGLHCGSRDQLVLPFRALTTHITFTQMSMCKKGAGGGIDNIQMNNSKDGRQTCVSSILFCTLCFKQDTFHPEWNMTRNTNDSYTYIHHRSIPTPCLLSPRTAGL